MRRLFPIQLALVSVLIAACVTINVYFPAAAAEKAADKIIEDVWGKTEGEAPKAQPNDNTTGRTQPEAQRMLFAAIGTVLDFMVQPAHAQADLDVSTPEIRAIIASMEGRHGQLAKYYSSGAIGLTADGMVDVRDQNAIPLPERTAARKLVTDENKDRAALYTEIAKANNHPEWEADIRSTFAQRWIAKAGAGWYYKDAGGAWKQK
jgi:uncharacterized protein